LAAVYESDSLCVGVQDGVTPSTEEAFGIGNRDRRVRFERQAISCLFLGFPSADERRDGKKARDSLKRLQARCNEDTGNLVKVAMNLGSLGVLNCVAGWEKTGGNGLRRAR